VTTVSSPSTHGYRGRLAPSPTGYLHLGHARTFWITQQRAQQSHGVLVLRNEDLDPDRCKPQFASAMLEDLRWFGFRWQEGPDCGGLFGPYSQSERRPFYVAAFRLLLERGVIYPCTCSRRDVLRALRAPHAGEEEPVYPGTCRPATGSKFRVPGPAYWEPQLNPKLGGRNGQPNINWRFRVPDGEAVQFRDQGQENKPLSPERLWRLRDLAA
jgi:glutamyl-tRNA synthetase